MRNDEALKVPVWTTFSAAAWFQFSEDFVNYRMLGGLLTLERCISARCKLACRHEFGFDRWRKGTSDRDKLEKVETETSRQEAREKKKKNAQDPDEIAHDDEIMLLFNRYFAPPNSFVSQSRFQKLHMQLANLEALRTYNMAFATTEQQCSGVLPPARILAQIYAAGLVPFSIKDRVMMQEFATWHEARMEALSLYKNVDALSHLMGFVRSSAPGISNDSEPERKTVRDVPTPGKRIICYKCQQPGHIAKECPTRAKTTAAIWTEADLEEDSLERLEPGQTPEVSWPIEDCPVMAVTTVKPKKKCQKTAKKLAVPDESVKKLTADQKKSSKCFVCGKSGHISYACPEVKKHWACQRGIKPDLADCEWMPDEM